MDARRANSRSIRRRPGDPTEIARAIPLYKGIETLRAKGDQVQGGRNLHADAGGSRPPTAHLRRSGPAGGRHRPIQLQQAFQRESDVSLSTRRGKQFNSMVREVDPLTGAARDEVLISQEDLDRLRIAPGARVRLRSATGSFEGRLRNALIRSGNLEVPRPEGNILLSASRTWIRSPWSPTTTRW